MCEEIDLSPKAQHTGSHSQSRVKALVSFNPKHASGKTKRSVKKGKLNQAGGGRGILNTRNRQGFKQVGSGRQ